jgi:hypothetical protein
MGTKAGAKAPTTNKTFVAACQIKHDSPLPLSVNIAYTVSRVADTTAAADAKSKDKTSAKNNDSKDQSGNTQTSATGPSPVDCSAVTSDSPCKISRTFADNDRNTGTLVRASRFPECASVSIPPQISRRSPA